MIDFMEMKQRYQNMSAEEKAARDKEILKQRQDEAIKKQRISVQKEEERQEKYFNSLPKRFKDASFSNFIGLEKEKNLISRLTGGVLYGKNGNGKSHLGYAACRKIVETHGTARLIKAFDFFNEIKKEFNSPGTSGDTIRKYSKLDFLVIDECDKGYGSQTEYLNLIDLIGKRYDEKLPTLLISNCETLQDLSEIISISCLDKLREGENIYMGYQSMRGKEDQKAIREKQEALKNA